MLPLEELGQTPTKVCPTCREDKPLDAYYPNPSVKSGLHRECKPCLKKRTKRWTRANHKRAMVERAKRRAKENMLPFDLTEDDFEIPERCPILDIFLEVGGGRIENSPSLDRIVPARGYVRGNVIVTSNRANRLKQDLDPRDMHRFATRWVNIYHQSKEAYATAT